MLKYFIRNHNFYREIELVYRRALYANKFHTFENPLLYAFKSKISPFINPEDNFFLQILEESKKKYPLHIETINFEKLKKFHSFTLF